MTAGPGNEILQAFRGAWPILPIRRGFRCPDAPADRGNRARRGRPALRGEEDIRRLPDGMMAIADTHGVQCLIRDAGRPDGARRRLPDRFP